MQIVAVQTILEAAEVDGGVGVAEVNSRARVVVRDGLLERQEQLSQAAFAGAVDAKDHRQWGHAQRTRVLPGLEILDAEVGQHGVLAVAGAVLLMPLSP